MLSVRYTQPRATPSQDGYVLNVRYTQPHATPSPYRRTVSLDSLYAGWFKPQPTSECAGHDTQYLCVSASLKLASTRHAGGQAGRGTGNQAERQGGRKGGMDIRRERGREIPTPVDAQPSLVEGLCTHVSALDGTQA